MNLGSEIAQMREVGDVFVTETPENGVITTESSPSSLVTEKILILFGVAAVTFLFGMLPLLLFSKLRDNPEERTQARWKLVISFFSCFGGGVFLGALLLDLLPDVEEQFEAIAREVQEQYSVSISFPLAELVVVLGFLLILTIEQTALHFQEKWAQGENQPLLSGTQTAAVVTGVHSEVESGHHSHDHVSQAVFQHSSLRSVMLLLALSFHSVFDGLAIGLQKDSSSLIAILVAVMLHKAVMSFSLGLSIAQSNLSVKSFILSNILFAVSSPIGIGIGIGLLELPQSLAVDVTEGVLQGLAGGTFLYITFFEVLPQELNVAKNRLWKAAAVAAGFIVIAVIIAVA